MWTNKYFINEICGQINTLLMKSGQINTILMKDENK